MNILALTYGLPYPPKSGSQLRDFHLLRQLAAKHRVFLFSLVTEDRPADLGELNDFCASIETFRLPRLPKLAGALRWPLACVPFYVPEMASRVHAMVTSGLVDAVQIEHSFLGAYRDFIPEGSNCRTVLSLHNIGALQYRSIATLDHGFPRNLMYGVKAWLMRDWELRLAERFDHSLVVSSEDGRYLAQGRRAVPFSVIENGVDAGGMQPIRERAERNELLFVGVLGYPPNSDAVLYFNREILPLIGSEIPDVHLTVVGRAAPDRVARLDGSGRVTVAGFVEDLLPYYRDAKIAVVPLRAGGGTRLKILEAMALGRPVVSTSAGCEGLAVEPGRDLLVADTPVEFARCVVRLLRDEGLRDEIAESARRLVEQRYDWGVIGRKLIDVYDELFAAAVTV